MAFNIIFIEGGRRGFTPSTGRFPGGGAGPPGNFLEFALKIVLIYLVLVFGISLIIKFEYFFSGNKYQICPILVLCTYTIFVAKITFTDQTHF